MTDPEEQPAGLPAEKPAEKPATPREVVAEARRRVKAIDRALTRERIAAVADINARPVFELCDDLERLAKRLRRDQVTQRFGCGAVRGV